MPRRRGFVQRSLSLTPLVDVIFLLLLFFMLTSTFSRYSEIELGAATGGARAASEGDIRFVRLGSEDILLAGRPVPLAALAQQLTDTTTFLSLDEDVDAQRLVDVLGVLNPVPNLTLSVLQ